MILVRLKDGKEIQGRLIEQDNYMNLVLVKATELNKGVPVAKFGEVFIIGNNILFIKPDVTKIEEEDTI